MENIANTICNICMETDLSQAISGTLIPCMHIFCFDCIEKWLKCKHSCPNCLSKASNLKKKTKTGVEVMEVTLHFFNEDSKEKENFDCLDHEYFKTEMKNLEKRLNKIILTLSKNTKDFNLENKWHLIEEFKRQIKTKNEIILHLDHFDSTQFVKDIYELDSLFRKIELNKWNEINMEQYIEHCIPNKFYDENNLIVDDYYYEDEYYDEEYDDNMYYGRKYSSQFEINNYKKAPPVQKPATEVKKKKGKKKGKATMI